jgi:hypothetical protein
MGGKEILDMKTLFPSALLIAAVVLLLLVSGRAADKNTNCPQRNHSIMQADS